METSKKVMNIGGLYLQGDTTVTRCFRCNGFNHSKVKCPKSIVCPLCVRTHQLGACQSIVRMCSNCCDLKSMYGFDVDTEHPAFDHLWKQWQIVQTCLIFSFY